MTTTDLLGRARAGDEQAFRDLTEPYRRELHVHCYRMLGSVQDAEDALQETWVAAWRGLAGFGERSSVRTWLYWIATNTCLNALRAARRRPAKAWEVVGVEQPEPTGLGTVVWLGPYPDALLDAVPDGLVGPEARYERRESVSLAFVAALQLLPPRGLAALVLRDVLGFRASEVAAMLGTSVPSVESALHRARAVLAREHVEPGAGAAPAAGSAGERAVVSRFVEAYEAADLDALVDLFTDDVFLSMPPMPLEYRGLDPVLRFFGLLLAPGRRYRLVETRANGGPAFGTYLRAPDGTARASGLFTATIARDRIGAMTRFEPTELARFGLPAVLPAP
ncbi:RNA polymerase subunit sigma-70 [Luteimicrobium sp. NPDC057192]|uniref:RNA polymerase subunit sigma-70 n=1 Tax=Luteimicrobium sp. NPDC057192 TaxID=3346042 RepID=UPI003642C6BE